MEYVEDDFTDALIDTICGDNGLIRQIKVQEVLYNRAVRQAITINNLTL